MVMKLCITNDEGDLTSALGDIEKEFAGITFETKVKDKKLVPLETIVDLTIKIGTGITIAVLTKLLDRIWQKFREKKIAIRSYEPEVIQNAVERYLLSNGINKFELLKRVDKGPYEEFVYGDKRNQHLISIATFDLKILSYERKVRK